MNVSHPRCVTLVDDDDDFREALVERLQLEELEVQAFASAEAALKALTADYPGVVVSDLRMPGMDGRGLLARLQALDGGLPVVMITGHSERSRVIQARDAGVNEFVVKPLTARALLGRLDSVIMRPRPYIRCKTYFGPDRRRTSDQHYSGPFRRNTDGVI